MYTKCFQSGYGNKCVSELITSVTSDHSQVNKLSGSVSDGKSSCRLFTVSKSVFQYLNINDHKISLVDPCVWFLKVLGSFYARKEMHVFISWKRIMHLT